MSSKTRLRYSRWKSLGEVKEGYDTMVIVTDPAFTYKVSDCVQRKFTIQSVASYLSQGFVMFFHVSCEALGSR